MNRRDRMGWGAPGTTRLLAVLLLSAALPRALRANDDETVRTLLAKTRRAYEGLETYEDEGVVLFSTQGGTIQRSKEFRIFFKHPRMLRFEWSEKLAYCDAEDRHVLWSDGEDTYHYWERAGQYRKEPSVTVALAGAKAISGGASYVVPLLLLMKFQDSTPYKLVDRHLLPEDEVDGVPCHVVQGTDKNGDLWKLWISQESEFFLKIERTRRVKDHTPRASAIPEIITESHREIVPNGEIPDEIFEFEPRADVELVKEFGTGH